MNPKVFISYSWHPEENKIRVQQLARRLMSDGVDVILDVWSLKDGQDKYVFMGKMVTDSNINKVLIICNKDYAEKADT
nr:toll/interleukin-1 receptor domain-containing protein [Prevotella sp.]